MDLNYLLSRHQIALMQADTASCREARVAHRTRASCYADRIHRLRLSLGAVSALLPLN